MKVLKRTIVVLLLLAVVILILVAFLPSKRHIEASLTINTPAKSIYAQVIDLKNWNSWSPFKEGDTAMTTTYEGSEKGVGAIMSWKSKKQGNGVMTIMETVKDKSIRTKIDFEDQGSSFSDWTFTEDSNKTTKVTWSMDLDNLTYPMGRIMGLVMNSMIKKSFDKGLAKLKKVSEDYFKMVSVYKTTDIKVKQTEKQYALVIKDSSACDEVDAVMGKVFGEIGKYMGENKIEVAGYPFAKCYLWDEKANKYIAEIGFVIKNKTEGKGNIKCIEIPSAKVVSAIHNGSYETSGFTHMAIDNYIKENKLTCIGIPIEIYITDPGNEPDMTRWQTEIIYPVK